MSVNPDVIVVGAGIIGVCTGYFLRRAGMDVTVVERRPGVAQETSLANAGVAYLILKEWSARGKWPGRQACATLTWATSRARGS